MKIQSITNLLPLQHKTLEQDIKIFENGQDPYPPKPTEISFLGYNSPLKTAFRKGALGDRVNGIYGNRLTQDTVSIEHIIPVSKGGNKNDIGNQFLATKRANNERGTKNILELITLGDVRAYFKQFKDVKTKYFDGDKYILAVKKTLKRLMEE